MRITFFSNFFNAHQLPLALEFDAMEGVDYAFVSLLPNAGSVGRSCLDDDYGFVLKEYQDESHAARAMEHALDDDVVVFGDMADKEKYVRARAKTGKPFFRYAERVLKRGDWWRFVPPKMFRTWNWFVRYKDCNMRVLCSSAYTARDLSLFGFPSDKCLKWGYFPQTQDVGGVVGVERLLNRYKTLCSAQRLIPVKRVERQLHALKRVIDKGNDVTLDIAGDGPERQRLEALTVELGLANRVRFLGELSHEETLGLMREHGIFLATSDRGEGWGAVVNEAMSMSCCVVASDEMGSVPYLIQDGVNGLSFHGDGEAPEKIIQAISDPDAVRDMGDEARRTVEGIWSAGEAARRFAELAEALLNGRESRLWPEGPLSDAGDGIYA